MPLTRLNCAQVIGSVPSVALPVGEFTTQPLSCHTVPSSTNTNTPPPNSLSLESVEASPPAAELSASVARLNVPAPLSYTQIPLPTASPPVASLIITRSPSASVTPSITPPVSVQTSLLYDKFVISSVAEPLLTLLSILVNPFVATLAAAF